jgi:hypothetical protein
MLSLAAAIFFISTLVGAILIIGWMFFQYRAKIESVLLSGFSGEKMLPTVVCKTHRPVEIRQRNLVFSRRSLLKTPLRVAA